MDRRLAWASIIVTSIVALLLIDLTIETPSQQAATIPEPEKAAAVQAIVATVTLPPPPEAAPEPSPEPAQEITPLTAAVSAPEVQEIEPLKKQPQATAEAAPEAKTIEPLKARPKTTEPLKARPKTTEPLKARPKTIEPLKARPKTIEPLKARPKTIEPLKARPKTIEPLKARQPETPPPAPVVKIKSPQQAPQDAKTAAQTGRPLLRMMEHGDGPSIEISWPRDSRARADLYRVFSQCYGMRVALMTAAGSLYDEASDPGQAWPINTDRFSGFLRRSQGGATADELATTRRIRARHGLSNAAAVRVFPRQTDAVLLGGLKNLTGDGYANGQTIRAAYRLSGWRVGIADIHVDSRPVAGEVDLSGAARSGCRI